MTNYYGLYIDTRMGVNCDALVYNGYPYNSEGYPPFSGIERLITRFDDERV